VVAQFPGNGDGPFYLLGAHLDSTSPDIQNNAPGADDNASGSAGALEVATLLAKHPQAKKVRFVLFAGEEVGIRGSGAYAKELASTGEIKKCLGAVIFDMIGWDRNHRSPRSSRRASSRRRSSSPSSPRRAPELRRHDQLQPVGSDHIPFLKQNVPTFLFIEDEFETNSNYHQTSDREGRQLRPPPHGEGGRRGVPAAHREKLKTGPAPSGPQARTDSPEQTRLGGSFRSDESSGPEGRLTSGGGGGGAPVAPSAGAARGDLVAR
jgi:Zn-dependent M28 family amino/carboxypeptidase